MSTQTPQPPTASARGSCLAPSRSTDAPLEGAADQYERLFPDLPHIFVLQLHLAMLRLHNRVVDHLRRSAAVPESAIFDEARRTVSWHHQSVVINDYLPRLVGPGPGRQETARRPALRP